MKAVLISIQPKWCELIASGKKTVEVRKTKPKIDVPFKCYIYATWNGNSREILVKEGKAIFTADYRTMAKRASGKVIGEFVCDTFITDRTFGHDILLKAAACLSDAEAAAYCVNNEMYGWHISDLVIYDNPKALSEFFHSCDKPKGTDCSVCLDRRENKCKAITRPPQSWCYIEERSNQ